MKKINFKQIDLLRRRREEDNLAEPYFIETKKYIKKGIFIGLVLIATSLVAGIPFIYRIKVLENKKDKLKIFSDEYDLIEKKLNEEQQQLNLLSSFNKKLKDSILNISSSSALFKEIALIIPKDIQILNFNSKGNKLILKSRLPNDEYLRVINAFLINLDKSELVKFNDIDLKEIKSMDGNYNDKDYLFIINSKVSTDFKDINEKYLIKLGSYGLFKRLNILKNINNSTYWDNDMKNLKRGKNNLITPEKAASFIPIFISSGISILLVIFFVIPQYIRTTKVNFELNQLIRKKNDLENLRSKYDEVNKKFIKLNKAKLSIINLISGNSNLETLLTKLGEIGKKHNIAFDSIITKKITNFVETSSEKNLNTNNNQANLINDNLLVEGTKKYQIEFKFKTDFNKLLSFLREIEFQENIILLDNINIKYEKNLLDPLKVDLIMTIYGKL